MLPEWASAALLMYMVLDGSIGMYFKHKHQGFYSDGMVRMYSPLLFLTIPAILICKIFGKSHVVEIPEGVHKISHKQYKEISKKEEGDDSPR